MVGAMLAWSALTAQGEIKFAGFLMDGRQQFIALRDTVSKDTSPWLRLGQSWQGQTLIAFNPATFSVTLRQQENQVVEISSVPNDGPQERLFAVRASPPRGFASKSFEKFALVADGITYRLTWDIGSTHNAPTLSADKVYDFTLIERSYPRLYGADRWYDIAAVAIGHEVLYDREICEVHGGQLRKIEIPTTHGLQAIYLRLTEDRHHLFPHTLSGRITTCMPIQGEPLLETVRVCNDCEAAFKKWDEIHRPKR